MTLLNHELGALAAAVAVELGEGWHVLQDPQGWHGPAYLAGPDGAELVLSSDWDDKGLLKISPVVPPHSLRGVKTPSVTVGETLGAPVIAGAITGRLLPGYRAALARIAADNEARRGHFLRRLALAEELAALAGDAAVTAPDHSTRTTVSWHRASGTSADIVIHDTAQGGQITVWGLSPDQLRALVAFLATGS